MMPGLSMCWKKSVWHSRSFESVLKLKIKTNLYSAIKSEDSEVLITHV